MFEAELPGGSAEALDVDEQVRRLPFPYLFSFTPNLPDNLSISFFIVRRDGILISQDDSSTLKSKLYLVLPQPDEDLPFFFKVDSYLET